MRGNLKSKAVPKRSSPPPVLRDEQPLLRLLVEESSRRGDSLSALSKILGVTYVRLTQWRRNEHEIARARRSVHEKAAAYLGIPVVVALVLANVVTLSELVWPQEEPLNDRVERELKRLQQDVLFAAFMPHDLTTASPSVKLFVVFLFHELGAGRGHEGSSARWLNALNRLAAGSVEAQGEWMSLRAKMSKEERLF